MTRKPRPTRRKPKVVRYEDGSSYNTKTGKVTRSNSPRPSRRK